MGVFRIKKMFSFNIYELVFRFCGFNLSPGLRGVR